MITINELFSGIGAQVAALKRLGIEYETVGIAEIDRFAIQSYEAINGKTRNYGDVSKVEKLDYADLWTYSSPCFTSDTLILTERRGYRPIVDVQIGEKVLTHDGSHKTVTNSFCTGVKSTIKLRGMGFDSIEVTPEHRFYVRSANCVWNNSARRYEKVFSAPIWKESGKLVTGDYVGFSVNQKSVIPVWEGITFHWSDGRKDRYKNELNCLMGNSAFWWLMGRWVADGYNRKNMGITICCGKKKYENFQQEMKDLPFLYTVSEGRTVYKIHFSKKELASFTTQFGSHADGKFLPNFVLDLPIDLLKRFIDGYMSGDGYYGVKNKASSVSRILIYGLSQCVAKAYKVPFSIYKTKRKSTTIIEGRTVNQRDTYELTWRANRKKRDHAFYEDGFIWFPFRTLEDNGDKEVFDLTVEENHSFIANNCIVHNCQDFSVAGKQKGLVDENGEQTRSGLLLEVERLLQKAVADGKAPKYLLLENVKNLVGKKFRPDFDKWLNTLEKLGYNNYWKVLNAKDYGVPQNRERVFVVSIRKDVDTHGYTFPEPFKLERRLKDILETNVDEKYYLKQELVETFIKRLAKQEVGLPAEQMLEINQSGCSNTPTTVGKDNLVVEPNVLTPKRTEYGKTIRKEYEAGNIQESRHNMTEMKPRTDGISNTLTTVQKDNLVMCVPINTCTDGTAPALTAHLHKETVKDCTKLDRHSPALGVKEIGSEIRIRKLTPKECWRLMNFTDEEYEAAEKAGVSKTQLYKQAGNSIVVAVLTAIFKNLFQVSRNESPDWRQNWNN